MVGTKCVRVLLLRPLAQLDSPCRRHPVVDEDDAGPVKERLLEGTVGAHHQLDVDALVLEELDHRAGHRPAGRRDQRFHLARQSDHFTAGRPLVRKHYRRDDVNRNA
jgi:hypothetical protein